MVHKKNKHIDYAGFWLRLISYVIDSAIILLFLSGLFTLLFLMVFPDSFSTLIFLLVPWLYFSLMESSTYQATFGKLIVGLKVTDMGGKPITFARASVRFFGKILSFTLLFVGFLMVAFTKKKQGLHDILAECLVIKRD